MANTSVTWLNGYKDTDSVTEYPTKVSISNRELDGPGGIVDAPFVCGHKTVQTASDLQKIPGCVLSMSVGNTPYANRSSIDKDKDGNIPDALGQEWFVQDEKCKYKVVGFDGTSSTWEKIENTSYVGNQITSYISDVNNIINGIREDLSNNWSYTYNTYNAYNALREDVFNNWSYTYNTYNAYNALREDLSNNWSYTYNTYNAYNALREDVSNNWSYTYNTYNAYNALREDVSNNWSYTYNTYNAYNALREDVFNNWSYTYNTYNAYNALREDVFNNWSYTYNAYNALRQEIISGNIDLFSKNSNIVTNINTGLKTDTEYSIDYTKQIYDKDSNKYTESTYSVILTSAKFTDKEKTAGLMSAEDKYRIDSIWEGDKTIALMNFDTDNCKWTVYKNDGTTSYTNSVVVGMSSSNTTTSQSINVEYGFKVKWTGRWKWISGNDYKGAERCTGSITGTTLPAANTYSSSYTSPIKEYANRGTILTQTIYADKRGLIIDGYPDSAGASNDGTRHSGRIRPASGADSRSLSVSLGYYYLFFYGAMNAIPSDMSKIKALNVKNCTSKNVICQYTTTTANPYFVFAYPTGFGNVSTIKKNGVEIITTSFLKVSSFNYVNGAGITIPYNVYRTGAGVANMSITIS